MTRRHKLTWDKSRGRWKIKYKGKQHYFKYGNSKSDQAGYQRAFADWLKKKAVIDLEFEFSKPYQAEYKIGVETRRHLSVAALQAGEHELSAKLESEADFLLCRFQGTDQPPKLTFKEQDPFWCIVEDARKKHNEEFDAPPLSPVADFVAIETKAVWEDRLSKLEKSKDKSIAENAKHFLERKLLRVPKYISLGRYDNIRSQLDVFMTKHGSNRPMDSIDAGTAEDFHSYLLEKVKDNSCSKSHARDCFATFKQFVFWAFGRDLLELPKNLLEKRGDLTFSVTPQKIEIYDDAEVQKMLNSRNERTMLYVLLALNCGMTQKDISDLHPSQVGWNTKTITRKRSKTSDEENVPIVTYPLWEKTFKLLKKYQSDNPNHVLVNRTGSPLVSDSLRPDGKRRKSDAIKNAFYRLGFSKFKFLRRTGASRFDGTKYENVIEKYLGHSPRGIARKNYIEPNQKTFSKAIKWLEKQFGQ